MTRSDKLAALANAACLSGAVSVFALTSGLPVIIVLGLWAYGTYTLYPTLCNGHMAREAEKKAHQAARDLERQMWKQMTRSGEGER